MTRTCGTCQLCCKVVAVEALAKPLGVWCAHIGAKFEGCRIYDERPDECRQYRCLWHLGFGDETLRPDRIHAVWGPVEGGHLVIHEDVAYRGDGRRALGNIIGKMRAAGREIFLYVGAEKSVLEKDGVSWRSLSSTSLKTSPRSSGV